MKIEITQKTSENLNALICALIIKIEQLAKKELWEIDQPMNECAELALKALEGQTTFEEFDNFKE